jgi:hypothetical protein
LLSLQQIMPGEWIQKTVQLDNHVSVHHDTIFTKMTHKMQLCMIVYCSLTTLHVSSDIFAHHQEHLTVFATTHVNKNKRCNYS